MAADGESPGLPPLIPGLLDDISLRCLARLPFSSHPHLSLVSKSWRSIFRSPLLFTLRSELNSIQPLLLFNLRTPTDSLWFLLDTSSRRIGLLRLPPPPLPTIRAAYVVLGPHLYLLGSLLNGTPSAAVQIFDARLRQWALGPNMSASREFAAAAALSGRIYALGGCSPDSDSWAESFDPLIGKWAPLQSPRQFRKEWMHVSAVLGGKLLAMADRGGVAFDPTAEKAWGTVSDTLDRGWRGRAAAVGGILYSFNVYGKMQGYDPTADEWKPVEGVEEDLPNFFNAVGMAIAGFGGSLWLVWEEMGKSGSMEVELCYAGVEVKKMADGRLRGMITRLDSVVLALPKGTLIRNYVILEL